MEQSVQTADVHEGAVVGKAHHFAFHHVSHIERTPNLCNFFVLLFVQERLVGKYGFVPSLVDPGHLDRKGLSYIFRGALHIVVGQLGHGNKTGYFLVHGDDAALDFFDDGGVDHFLAVQGCGDLVPVFAGLELFLGKQDVPVSVIALDDFGLDLVAFFELLRQWPVVFQNHFASGQYAVLFAAEIDHDVLVCDLHSFARDHFASRRQPERFFDLVHK